MHILAIFIEYMHWGGNPFDATHTASLICMMSKPTRGELHISKLAATMEKSHRLRSKLNTKCALTRPSLITFGWHHCHMFSSEDSLSVLSLAGNETPTDNEKTVPALASVDSSGNLQLHVPGCQKFQWNPLDSTGAVVCAIFPLDLQVHILVIIPCFLAPQY